MAAIRRCRLERGRADLAGPRLRHRPITETAARRGDRHPADFSRAFRRAHGISPSGYRHLAESAEGPAPRQQEQAAPAWRDDVQACQGPMGRGSCGGLRSRCRATFWRASHPAGSCARSRPGRNR
ncbi:hypothetical protein ABZ137_13420 [Streptomyces bobili]|uniref:hypothetical protein n=1 Tax=Streptomyces bobili TaxID=67280 RepID=UPI0033B64E21